MLKWLQFNQRLAALEREKSALLLKQREQIERARKNTISENDIQGIYQDHYFDLTQLDSERMYLVTRNLMACASRMMIPTPEEDQWERCGVTGYRFLTTRGIHELRKAIRGERTARREAALSWIGATTGLVGALTGLVAVLFFGS